MQKQSAIFDTCVILQDTDVIERANEIGYPIITDVVLREIDSLKKNPDVSKDVGRFFRNIGVDSENLLETPDGNKIKDGDRLTKFAYKNHFVFVLHREKYRSRGNNDSKIREIAKDYGFQFVIADRGNKIAAEAEGISSHFWRGSKGRVASKGTYQNSKYVPRKVVPFKLATEPRTLNDESSIVSALPGEGDKAYFGDRRASIILKLKLASGGEGVVYETSRNNTVAKIYHKSHLSKSRREKLELMISKPMEHPSICWPTEILVNASGDFCGYLMPKTEGVALQTSVFIPALLERKFPNWTRGNLVQIAHQFAKAVEYLNERNILIGDINPMNVLVTDDGAKISIVDCDSFQVEDFPCPVGTVNFTAANIQGKDYKTFLRTKPHEEFALATMIFMILMPGKPPYSQEGGTSQADNIRSGKFPYPLGKDFRSQNIARGPWRFIWSHFPYSIKEAFHDVFRNQKTVSPSNWVVLLETYKKEIEKGYHSDDVFPKVMKIPRKFAVTRKCDAEGCRNTFEVHKDVEGKALSEGKGLYCGSCLRKFELEKLARGTSTSHASRSQFSGTSSLTAAHTIPRNTRKTKGYTKSSSKQAKSPKQAKPSDSGVIRYILAATVAAAIAWLTSD